MISPATSTNIPVSLLTSQVHMVVESFKPLYTTLIVACIWPAMLVPLLAILLFFSTRETRKKPMFLVNVLSIMMGLTLGGVIIGLMMMALLDPLAEPSISLCLAFATLLPSSALFVESILLIRLWALYPYHTTPRRTFFSIFIPIALLKMARLTNLFVYLKHISDIPGDKRHTLLLLLRVWTKFPNYRVEGLLRVVDNTIMSMLFLAKLYKGRGFRSRGRGWSSTLEALFWIAVSNFIIPVILSIAQLVIVWISSDTFAVVPICIVNIYVEIVEVLLATVWAAGMQWQEGKTRSGFVLTTMFVGMDVSGTSTEAERKESAGGHEVGVEQPGCV